ncbi:hypothetical protein JCM19046_2217 [Bacillus sp. JCM 19046]|uniref:Uncharacterized protein n=1 Tax=Shouchella xiaoxiensis TaxID=766895 RepID=A0ABS2T2P3_9BACI|nr:anti-sigma-F factor Fin [Shouchella xiaoxiensis]MBM7841290.1 hypothetical protein [Shouchella xiaoxiensis]GAF14279.1 hypothetical protein JCM19045_3587 [Bacillus sp. JCM 19045]GAF17692.1 hypothetical protein JCM19046_2217 [Bacillus sp. JCM 19046]
MAVYYGCRHCNRTLGVVTEPVTHQDLGLNMLTEEEQRELVTVTDAGHLHVKVICEDCYGAYENNPQLYEWQHVIH